MPEPVRLLLVDDHPVVRDGLRGMCETADGFEVVGEAADGARALALAATLAPDVVLMDLRMPGMGGVEAITRLRDSGSTARVLVLTTYDTDREITAALDAGATGYLLKDAPREDLFGAIRAAAEGRSVLSPAVAGRLAARARAPRTGEPTARETEVLRLVSLGRSNREVARELFVSEATVKAHLSHVYEKLGVKDRAAAVAVAYERGLLGGGPTGGATNGAPPER
ncbi:response regulator transcription factor [Streptomyces calidiresistens]|uniref:Response regulator n=1 Tax=Streptomyces calidiresistens TaxID=1485586 RepID=A0A7W3T539_9ACTN|nr:response regulator transcription factor [Streptomyces calidiresistens]MBB0231077.1 response regulator [Streptomyces calidiresistens]